MEKINSSDILFLFMGLVLLIFGILLFFNGSYVSPKYGRIDFGEYHILIGAAFSSMGLWSVIGSVSKIINN